MEDMSLICPRNDLESATILDIAKEYSIDIRESSQGWGGKLGKEPQEKLVALRRQVVIVELPDEDAERKLRGDGHDVIIIDHHNYPGLSRWNPKSSLEQFCNLVGHEMTPEQRAIAVNDRDFIPGLSRMGLSYEEATNLRSRERDILGTNTLFSEACNSTQVRRKHFKDLDIVIAPDRYCTVLGEVIQWPSRKKYQEAADTNWPVMLKPCLLVFHSDENPSNIVQINYYGSKEMQPAFNEIVNEDDRCVTGFEMWCGGGEYSCFWGIKIKQKGEDGARSNADVDTLVDRVLSFVLIDGRPLRYYWTTFLFPFRFPDSAKPPKPTIPEVLLREKAPGYREEKDREDIQEAIYFLPHIRKLLYKYDKTEDRNEETVEDTVRKWILPLNQEENSIEIRISARNDAEIERKISFPVTEVALYRFFNDVHILSISVCQDTNSVIWGKPFWRILTDDAFQPSQTAPSLEDVLTFNNLGRIVYQTFAEQPEEQKIADEVVWLRTKTGGTEQEVATFRQEKYGLALSEDSFYPPLSPVIEEMVWRCAPDARGLKIEPLIDDRMFVHTCIALAGPKPEHRLGEERYHAAFSLSTYVDSFNSAWESQGGYAYDREWIQGFLEPMTDRRWYGISGNLYGFTRFSAVYMAFGDFFHRTISRHVRTMYLHMSLMAIFYRASAIYYAHKTAQLNQPKFFDLSKKEMKKYVEQVQEIHWEMIRFANKHWFRELSYQDQGIEIFNRQCKAMDIEQEYKSAREDIERTYEFLNIQYQSHLSQLSARVSIFVTVFAILAIITGIFGMNFLRSIPIVEYVLGSITILGIVMGAMGIVIIIPIVAFITYKIKKRTLFR